MNNILKYSSSILSIIINDISEHGPAIFRQRMCSNTALHIGNYNKKYLQIQPWHNCTYRYSSAITALITKGYLHHHHKHQGLDPFICSVCRVTTALANVSSVFQLFSFLVVCSNMISKEFGLVAFFASVKASSVRIHLSCPVCIQSVVYGARSRLFCGHRVCSLLEVSTTTFLPLQFFVSVRLSESNFLTHIKIQAKINFVYFQNSFRSHFPKNCSLNSNKNSF
jgi:hypothetical protein